MKEILEKIEADKEILSTMPKNNKKNIALYLKAVKELEQEYTKCKTEVFEELKKRYKKIVDIQVNEDIKNIKTEINDIENMLQVTEALKTSYEKMGMDKKIYKLDRFYKENLENINDEILEAINKFKEVGIELNEEDFNYSVYVTEYMHAFFEGVKSNNVNSDSIKKKFEEIYWKCPDLIIHIELNLRYIFLKKQNDINKYYEKRKKDLLETMNVKTVEIENKHAKLMKQFEKEKNTDKKLIIDMFLNEKLSPKDYTDNKIKENYLKIISENTMKKSNKEELNENVMKFLNSLYEYKNYLKFQFVFEDIKKKYQEKDQHKNEYNTVKKDIDSREKKLKWLNKKINGKRLFGKKKNNTEKLNAEYNALVSQIKEDYKRLDDAEIYTKIIENLTDNSTIYDVLKLASAFEIYLTEIVIEHNNSIENSEIEQFISELKKFIRNPYITITNNISILENKDIPIIISDRYKLLDFNITKDDVEETGIDALISILKSIEDKNNMNAAKINIDDMEFICSFKKNKIGNVINTIRVNGD